MAGALVTKTVKLAGFSIGAVTEPTSAFTSMGKTVNKVRNCGRQHTFDDHDSRALMRYVR